MISSKYVIFSCIVLMTAITSCDSSQVYDQYQTVAGAWDKDTKIEFDLPELDSTRPYNLFFNLRNTNKYKFSNLYLISEMKFPNGKIVTDTLEYQMTHADGSWLGTGFTDLKENKLIYKENFTFVEKGSYQVILQHAMRKNGQTDGLDQLEGIADVGFRIEFSESVNPE